MSLSLNVQLTVKSYENRWRAAAPRHSLFFALWAGAATWQHSTRRPRGWGHSIVAVVTWLCSHCPQNTASDGWNVCTGHSSGGTNDTDMYVPLLYSFSRTWTRFKAHVQILGMGSCICIQCRSCRMQNSPIWCWAWDGSRKQHGVFLGFVEVDVVPCAKDCGISPLQVAVPLALWRLPITILMTSSFCLPCRITPKNRLGWPL